MEMQTRKLALIQWILQVGSLETLQKVEAISRADGDWWDELGEEEKAAFSRESMMRRRVG